jgi:outer membrane protease
MTQFLPVKIRILYIILIQIALTAYFSNAYAQDYKNEAGIRINRALLGSGDYRAFLYQNYYTRYLHKRIALTGSLGYLFSSDNWSDHSFMAHQDSYFIGDVSLRFVPLLIKKHALHIGGGGSYLYSTQVRSDIGSSYSGSNTGLLIIDGNDIGRFHYIGYHILLEYNFLVTRRLPIGARLQFANFGNGGVISSTGLQAAYRF